MKKILLVLLLLISATITVHTVNATDLKGESEITNLVIFIRFNDEQDYEAPNSLGSYTSLFNSKTSNSLWGYFDEVSYNQLNVNTVLTEQNNQILFYTALEDRSYFEPYSETNPNGYNSGQQSHREHQLIKAALDYFDTEGVIDPSINLDVNQDGQIDSLTVLVSGETTEWSTLLWPHQWELYTFKYGGGFTEDAPRINGVAAYTYNLGLLGNGYSILELSTLAHEMFHVIGSPDLYHYYKDEGIDPVGIWDLMERNLTVPQHMLGYMKYQYGGWIDEATPMVDSTTYTLYPIREDGSNYYVYDTGYSNEYIYFEYRDAQSYDIDQGQEGLIVYRVDLDYQGMGNRNGMYNDNLESVNEVFVFRPGITDFIEPIIVENYSSGFIFDAALGNTYTEAGLGTNMPIFHSDGTLINIKINNVTIHDGYITFDFATPPRLMLDTMTDPLPLESTTLYDHPSVTYDVLVQGLKETQDLYYKFNVEDEYQLLDSNAISINNTVSSIFVKIKEGEELILETTYDILFNNIIESEHPYDENFDKFWYIEYLEPEEVILTFNDLFELYDDVDYLTIETSEGIETFYSKELKNIQLVYTTDFIKVHLHSEQKLYRADYGFLIDIQIIDNVDILLNGLEETNTEIYEDYIDQGATIVGVDSDSYTYNIVHNIDVSIFGDYIVSYELVNEYNEVVKTIERIVTVTDSTPPEVVLNGDYETTIEAGAEYIDLGVTATDNYSTELRIEVYSQLYETNKIGQFIVVYSVYDEYNNLTEIRRVVNIIDTTPPSIYLLPGVDTVLQGEEWIDGGINGIDSVSNQLSYYYHTDLDENIPGTYQVNYVLFDSSGNESYITRYVTVLEKERELEEVEIKCDLMITTYNETDTLDLKDCFINEEKMNMTHDVNIMIPGTYEVVYSLNGYKKYYYVYIYRTDPEPELYYDRRIYL